MVGTCQRSGCVSGWGNAREIAIIGHERDALLGCYGVILELFPRPRLGRGAIGSFGLRPNRQLHHFGHVRVLHLQSQHCHGLQHACALTQTRRVSSSCVAISSASAWKVALLTVRTHTRFSFVILWRRSKTSWLRASIETSVSLAKPDHEPDETTSTEEGDTDSSKGESSLITIKGLSHTATDNTITDNTITVSYLPSVVALRGAFLAAMTFGNTTVDLFHGCPCHSMKRLCSVGSFGWNRPVVTTLSVVLGGKAKQGNVRNLQPSRSIQSGTLTIWSFETNSLQFAHLQHTCESTTSATDNTVTEPRTTSMPSAQHIRRTYAHTITQDTIKVTYKLTLPACFRIVDPCGGPNLDSFHVVYM